MNTRRIVWHEVKQRFEEPDYVNIHGRIRHAKTDDTNVIAKIHCTTGEVKYIDNRAKTDGFTNEFINSIVQKINKLNTKSNYEKFLVGN